MENNIDVYMLRRKLQEKLRQNRDKDLSEPVPFSDYCEKGVKAVLDALTEITGVDFNHNVIR